LVEQRANAEAADAPTINIGSTLANGLRSSYAVA
jgi:hypothetical protein